VAVEVTAEPASWNGPAIFVVPFVAVPIVIVPVPTNPVPILIFVVEPVAPLVPKLIALVRPVVVAPDAMLKVAAEVVPYSFKVVAPAPSVNVVAAPNALIVVDAVLKTSILALPTTLVVNVGDVASATTVPEPIVE